MKKGKTVKNDIRGSGKIFTSPLEKSLEVCLKGCISDIPLRLKVLFGFNVIIILITKDLDKISNQTVENMLFYVRKKFEEDMENAKKHRRNINCEQKNYTEKCRYIGERETKNLLS